MAENESALTEGANTPTETASTDGEAAATAPAPEDAAPEAAAAPTEDISYHAVEKDGQVTAIWEMQGRKHLRTIDPRSRQGQDILRLYTAEHEQQ
jgi:3-oxoacyl-ACP reductase-like protein